MPFIQLHLLFFLFFSFFFFFVSFLITFTVWSKASIYLQWHVYLFLFYSLPYASSGTSQMEGNVSIGGEPMASISWPKAF